VPELRVGAQVQPQHASYGRMRDAWLRVEDAQPGVAHPPVRRVLRLHLRPYP